MILDPIKFSAIVGHFKITPNQLFVLYMIWKQNQLMLFDLPNIAEFISKKDLDYLIEIGYVEPIQSKLFLDEEGDMKYKVDLYDIVLTEEFTEMLFIEDNVLGRQLFDAYPMFLLINGQKVLAKSCNKDEYVKKYALKIDNNKSEHELVLDALNWAVNHNLINFSIKNFIDGELWHDLIKMKNSINPTTGNNTFL